MINLNSASDIKSLLDYHANLKNSDDNLFSIPDPLQVAKKHKRVDIALICALFAYGNAKNIVKFLNSLNFELLNESDDEIRKFYYKHKYRFQNEKDVAEIFISVKRLCGDYDLNTIFIDAIKRNNFIIDGVNDLIGHVNKVNSYKSDGYDFYFGKQYINAPKSPYKRYNMYLRWMVRKSDIDLGLFKNITPAQLYMPLDVHTHRVSLNLGLMSRKTYDFRAVEELTEKLRTFDVNDPIKYDFALYRIGQGKELDK